MFSFDSGFCMHNEAMPSHTTHADTPTPIKSHSLLHVQTQRKKKKKKNPRSLPHTAYQISELPPHPQSSRVIGCLVFNTTRVCVCVSVCCLLFIPVFNVVWLCSWGAELISFLMVGYQCLSQMNYAFLPYVISSQPGNTGTIW